MPASLIGSQVFQIKFDYQTALELVHQEDNGSIRVHLDLVIFSPFVLRSSDGTICNLDPQTSRTALAPVIDLFGGTITGVTVDGDDKVTTRILFSSGSARGGVAQAGEGQDDRVADAKQIPVGGARPDAHESPVTRCRYGLYQVAGSACPGCGGPRAWPVRSGPCPGGCLPGR